MRKLFFIAALLPALLSASPETCARRMQAFLLIGDPQSAVQEARLALKQEDPHPLIYEWAIRSLAASGEDSEMMKLWEELHAQFPERALKQELLEEMCWGILQKGKAAGSLSLQLISLIGAALAQDMRALPYLLAGMRHTNAQIRAVAVEVAAFYGDQPLKEEICALFQREIVLDVRLAIMDSIGKLELKEVLPDLIKCIANPKTGPREKLAAIEAIVQMQDCLGYDELKTLATSNRAGLRQLACQVIDVCELKTECEQLLPALMFDAQPEVRAAALRSWGLLRKPATAEIQQLACEALDPQVGITAAWVWLIDQPKEAEIAFSKWLKHERAEVRSLAAAAVAAAGHYGLELAKKYFKESNDIYVKINLALALARQREEHEAVCAFLSESMKKSSEKWMQSEKGLFKPLEKSKLSHNPAIPNYPEVVNQTVRLEMLNLLAILESPYALDALKNFLKEKKFGVTGLAAETLLGEGDETAIELVRELLKDPDPEVCLEAALVLASWGRDQSAIATLLDVYPKANRQLQLKILEALGRVGDKKVLPFLIERLKEPSLMLRVVAAAVMIQTLNN